MYEEVPYDLPKLYLEKSRLDKVDCSADSELGPVLSIVLDPEVFLQLEAVGVGHAGVDGLDVHGVHAPGTAVSEFSLNTKVMLVPMYALNTDITSVIFKIQPSDNQKENNNNMIKDSTFNYNFKNTNSQGKIKPKTYVYPGVASHTQLFRKSKGITWFWLTWMVYVEKAIVLVVS